MPIIENILFAIGGAAIASIGCAFYINKLSSLCRRYESALSGRDSILADTRNRLNDKITILHEQLGVRNQELARAKSAARTLAIRVRELGGEA